MKILKIKLLKKYFILFVKMDNLLNQFYNKIKNYLQELIKLIKFLNNTKF